MSESARALRSEIMEDNVWSLRELYRTLETPGDNKPAPDKRHACLELIRQRSLVELCRALLT